MDFSFPEDQQLMVDAFIELMCSRNWDTCLHECDEKHEYPLEWAEAIYELGFDRILLSEEHDGLGADWVTLTAAYEAFGREDGPTYVLYQLSRWDTVLREGTKEQKEKILSFISTGKQILNYAMTGSSARSSWDDIRTTYIREDGKVYLNGHRTFITFPLYASYLVVMARDPENMDTCTEWFVDMSLLGTTKEPLTELGLRMDSRCDVYFDSIELEEKDLLSKKDSGFRHGVADFDPERFFVALTNYGITYYVFENAAEYANQRTQDGQTIAHHQLVQLKFAKIKVRLASMRNMLYEITWKCGNGQLLRGDCSMAKYYYSEAFFGVIDRVLQILVSVGIAGDHRIQRSYRDLCVDRISSGTDEMMTLIIGRSALYPYH